MARIDENHEAVAHIRMVVDDDARAKQKAKQECEYRQQEEADAIADHTDPEPSVSDIDAHWKLGARLNLTDSMLIENSRKAQLLYKNFHKSLYKFLSENVADGCVRLEEPIKVCGRDIWGAS